MYVEEENLKQQYSVREKGGWNESHPWLVEQAADEESDVDEVIRYTLDEIRFA